MGLNDLEHETEVVHWERVISQQDPKEHADSKEAAAWELPLDRQAARVERQACITPTKVDVDVSSTNAWVPLYPNWVVRSTMKPAGQDMPTHYQTPKEDIARALMLSEELDEASVLDPLCLEFQLSQPDTADSSGVEGPKKQLHYSDVTSTVPPFDLAQLGVLPKMSQVTEQENDLLNLAPGSPIKHAAPPELSQSRNRSERSSYSRSPMSIGSPAGTSSLVRTLQVHTRLTTPTIFSGRRQSPALVVEEVVENFKIYPILANAPCLAHHCDEPNHNTSHHSFRIQ